MKVTMNDGVWTWDQLTIHYINALSIPSCLLKMLAKKWLATSALTLNHGGQACHWSWFVCRGLKLIGSGVS
jgi:hypothetical protein